MVLIDMDASCRTRSHVEYDSSRDFAGKKFSSGVLPPEMIATLNVDAIETYTDYWRPEMKSDPEFWKKIEPAMETDVLGYVVKSVGEADRNLQNLPYSPISASEKTDIWSFGVLLFKLCSRHDLLKVSGDDDISSASDFGALHAWDKNDAKTCVSKKVDDALARNLLVQLLAPESSRLGTMSDVLKHPFFQFGKDPVERNSIHVLFSDPLVWTDVNGEIYPINPRLNFDKERYLFEDCINNSGRHIVVSFHTATCDRLQKLANKRCDCLHFSGHGLPSSHLVLEESGTGGAHFLDAAGLREILPHIEPFKFVFVSACHSENIGMCFVEAGVRSVVCCDQNSELNDKASSDFLSSFYDVLISGLPIILAFESARGKISAQYGFNESKKFKLIPEGGDHNDRMFDADSVQWNGVGRVEKPSKVPTQAVPNDFVGREVFMNDVLCALFSGKRLMTFVSQRGMGLTSVASALCNYINERLEDILEIDEIFFLSLNKEVHDVEEALLLPLHRQIMKNAGETKCIQQDDDMNSRICEALDGAKALIVLDGIDAFKTGVRSLLRALFSKSGLVRVLLTAQSPTGFASPAVVETCCQLGPLDPESAVTMFVNNTDFAVTDAKRASFRDSLLSQTSEMANTDESIKSIYCDIHRGIPSGIIESARNMSEDKFFTLASSLKPQALQY
mmetsp:Transcript_17085/g.49356  ORF Transcript_17085/g.49356 Transcript_17085/m.49356 type:complete len:677 (-) Transcript_17085:1264-3294(-)